MTTAHRYFIVNKPWGMLSQFVSEKDGALLDDLAFDFPTGTHAIGRLDKHSEGLLLLTTNKNVTRWLFQSDVVHRRTYLVKVKHAVTEDQLQQLRIGISIRVKGGRPYTTAACEASIVPEPKGLFASANPFKDYPPHTWLLMTLTEGKFHQIRKMVKAIHRRCERLIRVSIEDLALNDLCSGEVREINESECFRLLKIDNWQPALAD